MCYEFARAGIEIDFYFHSLLIRYTLRAHMFECTIHTNCATFTSSIKVNISECRTTENGLDMVVIVTPIAVCFLFSSHLLIISMDILFAKAAC